LTISTNLPQQCGEKDMAMLANSDLVQRVESVRKFNRFYTQQIGVLREGLLESPFSLTEARVLYELAHRDSCSATELSKDLGLDPGYLSRILRAFSQQGLVKKLSSKDDARRSVLSLSVKGQGAFAKLNARSREQMAELLSQFSSHEQNRLIASMGQIEKLLGAPAEHKTPYLLRLHQPGDFGWIVHRHGVVYCQEMGWGENFEALVADIAGKFINSYDPKMERCWIAEKDGENVGSVVLAKKSKKIAQLRLLLVESKARGLGIGKRLVGECIRFARQVGYEKITLWTNEELIAARRIYQAEGFTVVSKEPHSMFGRNMVGETWELELR
jgi:DNA-binding MarR family transcriptional regulator/N-acetylglutamate synthase-like GNAT family acetyltransferase